MNNALVTLFEHRIPVRALEDNSTRAAYTASIRTLQNGGWKWVKRGQTRAYVRVLRREQGAIGFDLRSKGVREVRASDEGITGVTERSNYCLPLDRYFDDAAHRNAVAILADLID